MQVIHPLDPIYNESSEVLLLGSMPSITSREKAFYYAHPQNRFWQVIENIFNVSLNTFAEKTNCLLEKHIALWDTFKIVDINLSNDSTIKNYQLNDINKLIKNSQIKVIFCIGKASYKALTKSNIKIPIYYLPSTSSANAIKSLNDLINDYKIILKYLSN